LAVDLSKVAGNGKREKKGRTTARKARGKGLGGKTTRHIIEKISEKEGEILFPGENPIRKDRNKKGQGKKGK